MSHTPGPWTISDDHGKRWIETVIGNDDTICEIHRRNTRVGRDRDEQFHANAHLIAAAPDLLAALQHIDEYWNRDQNETAMADALWHIIETAQAAIYLATSR